MATTKGRNLAEKAYLESTMWWYVMFVSSYNTSRLVSNALKSLKAINPTQPNHQKKQSHESKHSRTAKTHHTFAPGPKGAAFAAFALGTTLIPTLRSVSAHRIQAEEQKIALGWLGANWVQLYVSCLSVVVGAGIFILFWVGLNLAAGNVFKYCKFN